MITLIVFNAAVITKASIELKYGLGTIFPFKPFNCFPCSTTWATVILLLLTYAKILTFHGLIITTTITTGFLIGSIIDKKYYS